MIGITSLLLTLLAQVGVPTHWAQVSPEMTAASQPIVDTFLGAHGWAAHRQSLRTVTLYTCYESTRRARSIYPVFTHIDLTNPRMVYANGITSQAVYGFDGTTSWARGYDRAFPIRAPVAVSALHQWAQYLPVILSGVCPLVCINPGTPDPPVLRSFHPDLGIATADLTLDSATGRITAIALLDPTPTPKPRTYTLKDYRAIGTLMYPFQWERSEGLTSVQTVMSLEINARTSDDLFQVWPEAAPVFTPFAPDRPNRPPVGPR